MEKDYKDLKVGKEFDVYQAKRSFLREWTRTIIALVILLDCLAALGMAAYLGDASEGEHALLKVWAVVSVPVGAVIRYYFRGTKLSGESDD